MAANMKKTPAELTRRSFLVGSVGTGVLMGFAAVLPAGCAREELQAKNFVPTLWFELSPDGTVVVNITKAEMGQHVGTALARVVADELGHRPSGRDGGPLVQDNPVPTGERGATVTSVAGPVGACAVK